MLSKLSGKKIWGLFLFLALSMGLVLGFFLLDRKPNKPTTKTASGEKVIVYLSMADKEIKIGQKSQASIFFNTGNALISEINLRFSYPYSGNFPEIEVSQIEINPSLLAIGSWNCPVRTASPTGGSMEIDIACISQNLDGYQNNDDILLATFDILARQVPETNPFGLGFDSNSSRALSQINAQPIPLLNVNPIYISVAEPSGTNNQKLAAVIDQVTTDRPTSDNSESLLNNLINEGQVLSSSSTPSATPTSSPSPTPTSSYWLTATGTPAPTSTNSSELLSAGSTPILFGLPLGLLLILLAGLVLI